jgi:cystathionine beta-synthase
MPMNISMWCVMFYFLQVKNSLVVSSLLHCRWGKLEVACLNLVSPLTVLPAVTCQECIDIMRKEGFDQLPVVDNGG